MTLAVRLHGHRGGQPWMPLPPAPMAPLLPLLAPVLALLPPPTVHPAPAARQPVLQTKLTIGFGLRSFQLAGAIVSRGLPPSRPACEAKVEPVGSRSDVGGNRLQVHVIFGLQLPAAHMSGKLQLQLTGMLLQQPLLQQPLSPARGGPFVGVQQRRRRRGYVRLLHAHKGRHGALSVLCGQSWKLSPVNLLRSHHGTSPASRSHSCPPARWWRWRQATKGQLAVCGSVEGNCTYRAAHSQLPRVYR